MTPSKPVRSGQAWGPLVATGGLTVPAGLCEPTSVTTFPLPTDGLDTAMHLSEAGPTSCCVRVVDQS
jgi:hypothetical protein